MNFSVKAVMFDVFGTVVDWRTSIAEEVSQVPELGGVDGAGFADAWRAKYQPSMEQIRSGQRPWTKLDELHHQNLLQVLDEFDLNNKLSEQQITHLNNAWHRLQPWPDSVEGLRRLKTKYIIATLSNGNVSLTVDMAKHANLPWDMVLGAEVVGHYKPQPQSYLKSAQLLSLQPEQCMLVAAHNGDLHAASRVGFRTAFVPRPLEHGPAQETDLEAAGEYDAVAVDFLDLAEQLGC